MHLMLNLTVLVVVDELLIAVTLPSLSRRPEARCFFCATAAATIAAALIYCAPPSEIGRSTLE